jgi:hypothetical protein
MGDDSIVVRYFFFHSLSSLSQYVPDFANENRRRMSKLTGVWTVAGAIRLWIGSVFLLSMHLGNYINFCSYNRIQFLELLYALPSLSGAKSTLKLTYVRPDSTLTIVAITYTLLRLLTRPRFGLSGFCFIFSHNLKQILNDVCTVALILGIN